MLARFKDTHGTSPRRSLLLITTAAMVLAMAGSASADSLTITAGPPSMDSDGGGRNVQNLTVNTVVDSPGSHQLTIESQDVGTACPATEGQGNGAWETVGGFGGQLQGSETNQISGTLPHGTVHHTHLCGYLTSNTGTTPGSPGTHSTTAVADVSSLQSYGDYAGYNVYGGLYLLQTGPQRMVFRFIASSSAGTKAYTDMPCNLSGDVRMTVTSKLRKKLRLNSTTLFSHAFKADTTLRVDWVLSKTLRAKLKAADLNHLPVTLTLQSDAPIGKTFKVTKDLYGARGVFGASFVLPKGDE